MLYSGMEAEDYAETKDGYGVAAEKGDGLFAIAYALMLQAQELNYIGRMLREIGFGTANSPGALEGIGKALFDLAGTKPLEGEK